MKAKAILQELNKALENFEQECNKSGKILEDVSIGFTSRYATLRAVIEDSVTEDDSIMTQCLWYNDGELEPETIQIFNY